MTAVSTKEPKLIQGPKRGQRGNGKPAFGTPLKLRGGSSYHASHQSSSATFDYNSRITLTPSYQDPSRLAEVTADGLENSEAFKSRVSEITSFRVYARVRPFIAEELAEMEGQERRSIVEMTGNKTILLDPKDDWTPKAQFEFDGSLWSIPPSHKLVHTFQDTARQGYATQLDVYNLVAKHLVPHVFEGYNSCILTYGQTGSGKTYTMMGQYDPNASCGGDGEEGIIPRVSNDLFLLLAERQAADAAKDLAAAQRTRYRVEVSFVEIYMERVRDLLDPALRHTRGNEKLQDARIRQDPYSGPFVEGVTKYEVENWGQCCTLLERGSQHRTTCATAIHNQSSRSHAIFQLTVLQEELIPPKSRYGRPGKRTKAGRINLVDLAGSERGGFQDYVKESSAINTSLLALRRVIDNLTERQNLLIEQVKAEILGTEYAERTLPQVPFRDSILTWLLSDSIGGNARTTMVATISPLVKNYGDTLATLQWSSKARNLVTFVKMNDEAILQDGLATRVGELGNQVQIQRNNLDDLRSTLRYKQQAAEQLEKETKVLAKQVDSVQSKQRALRKDCATLVLQRAMRRQLVKKKMAACASDLAAMTAQLQTASMGTPQAAQLRRAATEREAEAEARLRDAEKATQEVARRVSAAEAAQAGLEQRLQVARATRASLYTALDANGLCQRQASEKEAELQRAQQALEEARAAQAARQARVNEMEEYIRRSKTAQWSEDVSRAVGKVSELQAQRDALKEQRDSAQRLFTAVQARHTGAMHKSNSCGC